MSPPLLLVVGVVVTTPWASADVPEGLAEAVQPHTAPIRSIDPRDEDFADLAPIGEAIGDARIVALGEAGHGDGAALAAKARLVRYLYMDLGFNVLVWEAGFYDCWRAQRAFEAGLDVIDATPLGPYPFWWQSGQSREVFELAWDSYFNEEPLRFAGLAPEITGNRTERDWPRDLIDAFGDAKTEVFTKDERRSLLELGEGMARTQDPDLIIDLLEGLDDLRGRLDQLPAGDPLARQIWTLNIEDRMFDLRQRLAADAMPVHELASFNGRADLMGERLKWIAEYLYPEQKLIIWTSTWHALKRPGEITAKPRAEATANARTPGIMWHDAFGEDYYAIAFTAAGGATGWPRTTPVVWPDTASTLEGALNDVADAPFAFVDFRGLPDDHVARSPMPARLTGVEVAMRAHGDAGQRELTLTASWPDQVDGIFFIERMFPSAPEAIPEGESLTAEGRP